MLPDSNHVDLPSLCLSRNIANFSKLRTIGRKVVEPADQHDNPQRENPGSVLKLKILIQSHEQIERGEPPRPSAARS
jgi:hypothetical protein